MYNFWGKALGAPGGSWEPQVRLQSGEIEILYARNAGSSQDLSPGSQSSSHPGDMLVTVCKWAASRIWRGLFGIFVDVDFKNSPTCIFAFSSLWVYF